MSGNGFRPSTGKCGSKDLRYGSLRFVLNPVQMTLVAEALSVDLVNVFSSGRPCGKPTHFGLDLDSAEGLAVAWCRNSRRVNRISSQFLDVELLRVCVFQSLFWCAVAGTSIRS
jgi:hypothetical protein